MDSVNYDEGGGTELPSIVDSAQENRASIPADAPPTFRKLMLALTDFAGELMEFAREHCRS